MLLSLFVLAQSHAPAALPPVRERPHNVLILLADDLGIDQLAAYSDGADLAHTPVIDQLAEDGVLFRNVWANPWCSPTRATILTGRYGFRTGIGTYMTPSTPDAYALSISELTLPEVLDLGSGFTIAHTAIGKWHLGNPTVGGALAPNFAGFAGYSGALDNIVTPFSYYSWPKTVNGETSTANVYATTDTVDTALAWITGHAAADPWVCYVAFNAIHTPLHVPPESLYEVDLSSAHPHLNPRPYFVAALEALDAEIGRLLASLPADVLAQTTVIFTSDNGTPEDMVIPPVAPWQHKGTFYEGGVRVPLIVSGPLVNVPGAEVTALVNSTDLFSTAADLAGVDVSRVLPSDQALDSISIVPYLKDPSRPPLREAVYAEFFMPNGPGPATDGFQAMRAARYKLVRPLFGDEMLFDLELDPSEVVNLLEGTLTPEEQQAYTDLAGRLAKLLGP